MAKDAEGKRESELNQSEVKEVLRALEYDEISLVVAHKRLANIGGWIKATTMILAIGPYYMKRNPELHSNVSR